MMHVPASPGAAAPSPASLDPEPLLRGVIADPERHGRFANTLSMLEYVGARKILKSQAASSFTVELLAHASEEMRHALSLKRLTLRLDPTLVGYAPGHLLCGEAAGRYMQRVDRQAEADLQADGSAEGRGLPWINYLYTTLLVEERAGSLYPVYARLLEPGGHASVIHAIMREEGSHLRQVVAHLVRDDPAGERRLERLRAAEALAFDEWLRALERAVLDSGPAEPVLQSELP